MEPGLISSSKAVFAGPQFQNQAYEPGFLVNPFTADRRLISYNKPVICMTCGGFLNLYCTVNHTNGEWTCNLCEAANPSLDPPNVPSSSEEARLKRFPQLQAKHIDIVEDVFTGPGTAAAGSGSMIHVFAIDDTLCTLATDLKLFLKRLFSSLPQNLRVGVICYGKCLSLLRLCGGISQSVAVDALPGDGDATASIDHFIAQGVYLTPASVALEEVGRIAKTLYLLANEGSGQAGRRQGDRLSGPEPVCSVQAIVASACALGNVSGNPAVRLLIAAGRSIPHVRASLEAAHGMAEGSLSDGTREARHVSEYAKLGRHALFPPRSRSSDGGGGCWIDLVRVGFRSIRSDTLEALCGSSGGMVYHSFTLSDEHMLNSVCASLQLGPEHFPRGGSVCTLELRASRGLQISHVIGPVLCSDDAKEVPGIRLDLASVDVRHLHSSSVENAQANELVGLHGRHITDTVYVNKNAYKKLYVYNQEHTLVCGLGRLDPNTTVSVQCVPTADIQYEQRVGFQCVVRYACNAATLEDGQGHGGFREVIRVMNVQLICTNDKELYLQSLDAELWSVLMARSIVADFHVAQMKYESLRALQFRMSNDNDGAAQVAVPRDDAIRDIEALVLDLLQQWCPLSREGEVCMIGSDAAERSARVLYHLWLGPLLGGPSMHVQDAFLLRSHFLAVPARHALRLLYPQVEVVYEPSVEILSLHSAEKHNEVSALTQPMDAKSMAAAVMAHPPPSTPLFLPPPLHELPKTFSDYAPPSVHINIRPTGPTISNSPSSEQHLVEADSLCLLPGAVLVIDMGYKILIWDGGPLLKVMKEDLKESGSEDKKSIDAEKSLDAVRETALKLAFDNAIARARQRRPAAEVSTIAGGSPQERFAFSSLSPSHMDREEVRAVTAKHLRVPKWAPFMQSMVERCPHTDQYSFAMFLVRTSLTHGNEWCRMGSFIPLTEEDRQLKALQPVPMMDRGLMLGPSMDIIDIL